MKFQNFYKLRKNFCKYFSITVYIKFVKVHLNQHHSINKMKTGYMQISLFKKLGEIYNGNVEKKTAKNVL